MRVTPIFWQKFQNLNLNIQNQFHSQELNFVGFMILNPFPDMDRCTGPTRNNAPISKIFKLRLRTDIQSLCTKFGWIIFKATV